MQSDSISKNIVEKTKQSILSKEKNSLETVSYTHLTLPTILLV